MSQSSLKRVLVSEEEGNVFVMFLLDVAILFEASPGFGGKLAKLLFDELLESQSSLKRVLVSELERRKGKRRRWKPLSQSSLKRVLVSE